ncbi:TetR/AcrR family transcriptional regulator [Robertkochia flava]|uniref:TetR/AcrR family transcriptional regulator n=1 Tax=Robertkochia flava TaxID=3447986 RepID=UPI001CC9F26E|nr:TetR/AcrR family transcriptional regulator [Robertkochia marina]
MREIILNKSAEMFLHYGFKSVTMDEIAAQLGISKKTIYQHYRNKTELVEASVFYVFETICSEIDRVCGQDKSPIRELYEIKKVVREHLKNESSSPYNQLKKFYPKLFTQLIQKQYNVMIESVTENLHRGIAMGLFRDDIDVFFISRIYISGMNSIKDEELFPNENHSIQYLTTLFLEYHLRAIVTPKGLLELNQFINEEKTIQQ